MKKLLFNPDISNISEAISYDLNSNISIVFTIHFPFCPIMRQLFFVSIYI